MMILNQIAVYFSSFFLPAVLERDGSRQQQLGIGDLGQPNNAGPLPVSSRAPYNTVSVGDALYKISSESQIPVNLSSFCNLNDPRPATVLLPDSTEVSGQWLLETVESYLQADDVLIPEFLATIITVAPPSEKSLQLSSEAELLLTSWGATVSQLYLPQHAFLAPGPYFIDCNGLHPALKLYPDPQEAFVSGDMIAVPSRLLETRSADKPLAGLRVGVKDVIDVAGFRTGVSNRAYYNFYPPKTISAPLVQRLVDLGAIVVGKTKTTQFALGEEPTADWVDFHCPFNPRGDGYQTTEGSSAGSGAAIAAYEWLDLALGTDTTGSVRLPAAFQGVYGFRPTTGIISREGIVEVTSVYDTAGFLARDINTISEIMRLVTPNQNKWTVLPRRILYPKDYFSFEQHEPQAILKRFISKLEKYIGVQKTEIDIASVWKLDDPSGTGEDLSTYLNTTVSDILTSGSFQANSHFVNDYKSKYKKYPYISPLVQWTWEFGRQIGHSQIAESRKRKAVFQEWVKAGLLRPSDSSCSDSIMVFPFGDFSPRYRDTYRGPPSYTGFDWRPDFISPLAELPDLVIPVGQYPYFSRITRRSEYLPVSIAIVAASGCDSMLLELIQNMFELTDTPSVVQTGPYAFPRPD